MNSALSMLAAANCFAEEPKEKEAVVPEITLQSAFSSENFYHQRSQFRLNDLTVTAISSPSGSGTIQESIVGFKYDLADYSFEIDSREINGKRDFRSSAEIRLGEQAEFGLVALAGDRKSYASACASALISEQIRLEATADSESDLRLRSLYSNDKSQLSLTFGLQDSGSLASFSFNTRSFWLSGQYGENIPSGLKLAIGNIKHDISRKFDGYDAAGRNELPDFPDIHSVPLKNSLGMAPSFNFGGRSALTFLGEESGDMALMAEWRENSFITTELAVRLPNVGILREPYIMPGCNFNTEKHAAAFSLEAGTIIGKLGVRLRTEISETGSKSLGILGELRF